MTKNNKEIIRGLIPALILPIAFMYIYIRVRFVGDLDISSIIKRLYDINTLSALLAVGTMPNLILFLFAMNRERWHLGRGVIAATMIYGIAVMVIKFI